MAHLSRQTMGDRAVEQEVLALFVQQALDVRDRIAGASIDDRLNMAHGLKGSARGVGAFAIADCATDIERHPDESDNLERLGVLIEAARDFVAAIGR
jgi:HPt (histidine-containing phosphotransfer) domain-containing protein